MRGALVVALLASACVNGAEVTLDHGKLLYVGGSIVPQNEAISIELFRDGQRPSHDAAIATDCVQLDSSAKISANGTAGTISDYGAYVAIGTTGNCDTPELSVSLVPFPASIDLVLSDDSGSLHVGLDADANGRYQVTRCDAAQCSLSQW
jgi:hypothetical protein